MAYGLTELNRDAVKAARVIANPGCYPTTVQLPLVPLLQAGQIQSEDIIIDAKSGVSGAGRGAKTQFLYSEIAEGINCYGVGSHRHMPEIEQELTLVAGTDVSISFTPHLMCMTRGMQSTMYASLLSACPHKPCVLIFCDVTYSTVHSSPFCCVCCLLACIGGGISKFHPCI